jgi:hypothetical protein
MVELPLVVNAPVATVKVVDVAAAATVADAGTVRMELLFERLTLAPPVRAGWVRVTVQVLDEFGPIVLGVQDTVETDTDTTRLTAVLAELAL